MPITTAFPTQAKAEFLSGTHATADVYKAALIKPSPTGTYDAATTNYSQLTANSDEASGTGYTAGGVTLGAPSITVSGTTAMLDFADPSPLTSATISAAGVLIYNSSKSNKAVYVGAFPATVTSTAGNFQIDLPSAGSGTSLIRF